MMYTALLVIATLTSICRIGAEPIILDEILAVLPHPDGDIVMLSSDIQLSLGGEQRSFRSIILDGLMVLEARNLKLTAPDAAIEAVIANIQKQNHCSYAELNEQFERAGFSGSEMREIIKQRRLVEQLMGIVVRITEPSKDEVKEYATTHTTTQEAQYTIRLGYIPHEYIDDNTRRTLTENNTVPQETVWYDAETYPASNLSSDQAFIKELTTGSIVILEEHQDGYDIVQLVNKSEASTAPLEEQRALYELKEERYLQALEEFQEKLLNTATIRFCKDEELLKELLKKRESAE